MTIHSKDLHGKASNKDKRKVKKIISKRNTEVLCEIDDFLELEWLEQDDIEAVDRSECDAISSEEDLFPVIEN